MKSITAKFFLLFFLFLILPFSSFEHTLVSASEVETQANIKSYLSNDRLNTVIEGLIEPYAEIGPAYPGTNVQMKIGDVLYSTKTFGTTTKIVGHVGIVDSNFKVVHVTPAVDGGVIDNFTNYMNRHDPRETIVVMRPINGMGVGAARWANYNYMYINDYYIEPLAKLGTLNPNYCSKFLWQAFYFGEGIDINNVNNTPDLRGFITPSNFLNSPYFVRLTTFLTP